MGCASKRTITRRTSSRMYSDRVSFRSKHIREEIIRACELAKAAGADFVKTSTGFSTGGAKVEDVRLMRETVGPEMGVKASGGIHNEEEAMAMIEAGATRIGTSAGVAIVSGSTGEGY